MKVPIRLYKYEDQPLYDPSYTCDVDVPETITSIADIASYIEERAESGTVDRFCISLPSGAFMVTRNARGVSNIEALNF